MKFVQSSLFLFLFFGCHFLMNSETVVPRFVTNYDRKSFLNPPAALTRTSIWLLLHGKRQLRLMGPLCQKHYDIFRKSLRNLKTVVPTWTCTDGQLIKERPVFLCWATLMLDESNKIENGGKRNGEEEKKKNTLPLRNSMSRSVGVERFSCDFIIYNKCIKQQKVEYLLCGS